MPIALLLTALPEPDPGPGPDPEPGPGPGPGPELEDTATLAGAALRTLDWQVVQSPIDSLELNRGGVSVTAPAGRFRAADADLIWVLGFGRAATFLDKMQLLGGLNVPFVNRIDALLLLHAKYPTGLNAVDFPQPETHAANRAEALIAVAEAGGGRWVLKPPAGSFGRGVVIADAGSAELARAARILTDGGRYAVLQRWRPEVEDGEYRVLVAGGRIIGTYRRIGAPAQPAANLARGGHAVVAEPDPERDALALRAAAALARAGIRFAGLDITGSLILEANVINPGGLATLAALGDAHAAERAVSALLAD